MKLARKKWHKTTSWDETGWKTLADGSQVCQVHLYDGDQSSPLVVMSKLAPGWHYKAHTHDSDYCEIILEGTEQVGRTTHGPGTIRVARGGTGYGPLTVGPDGCTKLVLFFDSSRMAVVPLGPSETEVASTA